MRYLFFSLSISLIFVYACQRTTSSGPVEITGVPSLSKSIQLSNDYQELLQSEIPDTIPISKWHYDAEKNSLSFSTSDNKAGALAAYNHRLYLAFDKPILLENPKTLRLSPHSPFGYLNKAGAYQKAFLVNGVPYSGILIGIDKSSGARILEVQFYTGVRVNDFRICSNLGRWHERSFKEDMPQMIELAPMRKPVIYCYPTQAQQISIQLALKGEITHSYPHYPATGWTVWATPDGMLKDEQTGQTYPYLFWEGKSSYRYALDEGTVVAGKQSAAFLEQQLAHLGLNRREATDFITYWLPELEHSPYNLIHFSTTAYTEQAPLYITPAPETLIRVFMVYQPLNVPITVAHQTLPKVERHGYTVVEWGGKRAQQPLFTQ